tara:strand:- start:58437 stop:58904 length:468 start_codon:yes stop_codon:yes gene_type:complete
MKTPKNSEPSWKRDFGDKEIIDFIDERFKEAKLIDIINKNLSSEEKITNINHYDIGFKKTNKENQYYILKEMSERYYNKHPHDDHLNEHKIILLSRHYKKWSRFKEKKEVDFDFNKKNTMEMELEAKKIIELGMSEKNDFSENQEKERKNRFKLK